MDYMKRTPLSKLPILILFALWVILFPVKAHADTSVKSAQYTSNKFVYSISNGEATITGYDTSISGKITIPSSLGGYPVTAIGSWAFSNCTSINYITIPSSVKSIGNRAFYKCTRLTGITIPNSVTNIGEYAFCDCTNLASVTIPGSIDSISHSTFAACTNLINVTIGNGVTNIGDYAFRNCEKLTKVAVPDTIRSIGKAAFTYCFNLSNITIPHGVTSIRERTFDQCAGLTSINIPNSVISIGNSAFGGCIGLTSITIPDSVTSIGDSAFGACNSATSVTIPASVTSIGADAFNWCDSLTDVYISNTSAWCKIEFGDYHANPMWTSDNLHIIDSDGNEVHSITIDSTVAAIPDYAFKGCTSLINVTIENGVANIGDSAFSSCTGLTSITIPDNVTSIGSCAFSDCSSLISVSLPDSVTSIGYSAFGYCDVLAEVTYCGTAEQWSSINISSNNSKLINATRLYHNWATISCTIPATCTICGVSEENPKGHNYTDGICAVCGERKVLSSGTCGTGITYVLYETGQLVISGTGSMTNWSLSSHPGWYSLRELITEVQIEAGVVNIGDFAFDDCENITSVGIPDTVTNIGICAFRYCYKLNCLELPSNLNILGIDAFVDCYELSSIKLPDSLTTIPECAFMRSGLSTIDFGSGITSIELCAFSECKNLEELELPGNIQSIKNYAFADCERLRKVTFMDGVVTIGAGVLSNCTSLESIIIPKSISNIGIYAFSYCTSLRNITVDNKNNNYSTDTAGALYDKSKKLLICVPGAENEDYTIQPGVAIIDSYAFSGCADLRVVRIPDSVIAIRYLAFHKCLNLNHILYYGNAQQKNNLKIDESEQYLVNATWHINANDSMVSQTKNCINNGLYCTECNNFVVKQNPDDGTHNVIQIPGIAPTCTKTGLTEGSKCSQCDEVFLEQQTISAIGHNYTSQVTFATCTEQGYTKHTCCQCQDIYIDNYTSALGHNWQEATCTTAQVCTVCHIKEGKPLGHSGDIWIEIVAPTCTEPGIQARICDVCECTESVETQALGHSYESVVTAPTCTAQGYTTHTCSRCDDSYVDSFIDAKGHKWSAWIQAKTPTCAAEGSETRFCNCGTKEINSITKLPHSYADGVCSTCNHAMSGYVLLNTDMTLSGLGLTEDLYIDLNGHNLSGTIITNGFKVYGMDSTTDSYSCEAIGYFNCVDENGNAIVPELQFQSDLSGSVKRYITIETENGYTFHRFYLGITKVSLDPSVTGFGYKAEFYGDEMVQQQIASIGYNLWLNEDHVVSRTTAFKNALTLRLKNFDVVNYGETPVNASVCIILADGTIIESSTTSMSMRNMLESINVQYGKYSDVQLSAVKAMIEKHAIIKSWDTENLFA